MVRELTGMPRVKFQSLFSQRSFLDIERMFRCQAGPEVQGKSVAF